MAAVVVTDHAPAQLVEVSSDMGVAGSMFTQAMNDQGDAAASQFGS